jgi:hypothetical protein
VTLGKPLVRVRFAGCRMRPVSENESGRPATCARRPSPIVIHASDVFLPRGSPRAGRIASEREPMSYYRFAEIAALSFGLTFALVGWLDIVGSIWSALE